MRVKMHGPRSFADRATAETRAPSPAAGAEPEKTAAVHRSKRIIAGGLAVAALAPFGAAAASQAVEASQAVKTVAELQKDAMENQPSGYATEGRAALRADVARYFVRTQLDAEGVVYAPFRDEAAPQSKVRTNYAVAAPQMRTVFLSLDNGGDTFRGYEGFSQSEKQFARDVVEYAKEKGYRTVLLAHVPPNIDGRHGVNPPLEYKALNAAKEVGSWLGLSGKPHGPNLRRLADARAFLDTLDVVGVFAHVHPSSNQLLDVNGKPDLEGVILAGEKANSLTRITLYERGMGIEELAVEGSGSGVSTRIVSSLAIDDARIPVEDATSLGKVLGVTVATSDIQSADKAESHFEAIGKTLEAEAGRGHPVKLLVAGDYNVKGPSLASFVPQGIDVLYTPGGHCYRDNGATPAESVSRTVKLVVPEGSDLIDYEIGDIGY